MSILKFEPVDKNALHKDLRARVKAHFKDKGVDYHANPTMVSKTIIIMAMYFVPYALILTLPLPVWGLWLLTVAMGVALAGIGMSVMHDSCHGAYSSNKTVNNILSYSMNLIGGNRFNWVIQHNQKHHTYTNIYGHDEDLENGNVIRLSPYSEWLWFHKYQHIYSWFLYSLGTLSWVTIKDFKQFGGLYREQTGSKKLNFATEVMILVGSKLLYYGYTVVVPFLVLDLSIWAILAGFLTMHFVAGFILSVTFQLAHVVENTAHNNGKDLKDNTIHDSWAVHQVKTTANFARNSKLLNWYLGGLNFQVEHHLFPNVCHVHYREVSDIVKETVEDHGIAYNEYPTFFQAVKSHYRTLKHFSKRMPQPVPAG